MRKLALVPAVVLCLSGAAARAETTSTLEKAGTGVAIALPVVAGGISLFKHDGTGLAEMTVDTALTLGTAYALKQLVHEERPDGSDFHSFPSETAALAFAPAAFLYDRYGWQYGVPAYAAAAFVGYTRVEAKQHHWWDVAASAGISWGYSQIFTTRFHNVPRLTSTASVDPSGAFVSVKYSW